MENYRPLAEPMVEETSIIHIQMNNYLQYLTMNTTLTK